MTAGVQTKVIRIGRGCHYFPTMGDFYRFQGSDDLFAEKVEHPLFTSGDVDPGKWVHDVPIFTVNHMNQLDATIPWRAPLAWSRHILYPGILAGLA